MIGQAMKSSQTGRRRRSQRGRCTRVDLMKWPKPKKWRKLRFRRQEEKVVVDQNKQVVTSLPQGSKTHKVKLVVEVEDNLQEEVVKSFGRGVPRQEDEGVAEPGRHTGSATTDEPRSSAANGFHANEVAQGPCDCRK